VFQGSSSTVQIEEEPRPQVPSSAANKVPALQTAADAKPSVVSEGFSVVGNVLSTGTLLIEGHIKGNVSVETVTIGPQGSVEGSIVCNKLVVKGLFKGTAECEDLHVEAKATLEGILSYSRLSAQRGALIEGELLLRQ